MKLWLTDNLLMKLYMTKAFIKNCKPLYDMRTRNANLETLRNTIRRYNI